MLSLAKRLDNIEPLIMAQAGKLEDSVYGVVDKVSSDGTPNFVRRWKGTIGNMVPTDEEPTIYIIEKLEPIILKHKKYKCLFGGRAGTKSIAAMDAMAGDVNSCGSRVFVLRERMKSLKESVYAGINDRIKELNISGFAPYPSLWEIRHKAGGKFTFGGMQNIIDMKGSFKYKYFFMEEAARTSQQTIDILGPTLRSVPGAELWFVWNPESANDPMSLEFITPYQDAIDRDGFYEDDYHLIIKVGFEDNPWFMHDESLRTEYEKDKSKVESGLMSKARFYHIWHGEFNDMVTNSVIEPDWFDACVDAHKKLGFEARGAVVAGHDPADVGSDAKGLAIRHGVVFKTLQEIQAEDANRGFDVACREAKQAGCDAFIWDADGLGAVLRDQAGRNFNGTRVHTVMYKGSESPHHPEAVFKEAADYNIQSQKSNKDVFANKKAQNIIAFANRCKRTYDAVVNGVYHDPDSLISFDSEAIDSRIMAKFRAECCKMPLKPADTIKFYTKEEMRKGVLQPDGSRIKIPSPNLFDAAVISFDFAGTINASMIDKSHRPRPRKVMRR